VSDIPQAPDWWQASDGKWYPPQAGQAPADPFEQMQQGGTTPPSAPPSAAFGNLGYQVPNAGKGCMSVGMIITIITLLIGGAITAVVVFAVNDAEDAIDDATNFDDNDIDAAEVTDCGRGDFDYAEATLDVTNNTDDEATYFITVTFENQNGNRQFGTGSATASGVQPGRTVEVHTLGAVEVPAHFQCTVTRVQRV
jgi:hypothetical protein